MSDDTPRPSWQSELQDHLEALADAERDLLGARAVRALDRAAAAHPLQLPELARLSALAGYLAQRLGRRLELPSDSLSNALLYGLMAGYQLGVHSGVNEEPGPLDG